MKVTIKHKPSKFKGLWCCIAVDEHTGLEMRAVGRTPEQAEDRARKYLMRCVVPEYKG